MESESATGEGQYKRNPQTYSGLYTMYTKWPDSEGGFLTHTLGCSLVGRVDNLPMGRGISPISFNDCFVKLPLICKGYPCKSLEGPARIRFLLFYPH
jgi:hypothetical protein